MQKPYNGMARSGLAAAGFSHNAESLFPVDLEADAVHGLDVFFVRNDGFGLYGVIDLQVLYFQKNIIHFAHLPRISSSAPFCRPPESPEGAAPACISHRPGRTVARTGSPWDSPWGLEYFP